jgi:undecaprenyl-diphosphatase
MSQALDLNSIAQSAVRARGDLPGIVKTFFGCLDAREVLIVRKAVRASQSPAVHAAAAFINHLGNGWLYLAVAVLCPVLAGPGAWRLMLAGSVSAGVSHLFYRVIKPRLARTRPCDFDRALGSAVKALDKYSCPSGHCMTVAAVGIPSR